MQLYTLESGGILTPGIEIENGFFNLGNSTGLLTKGQILGAGIGRVFSVAFRNEANLILSTTAVSGDDGCGLLVRNQAREGEFWEMKGELRARCPFFGIGEDFWQQAEEGEEPTSECPKCYYNTLAQKISLADRNMTYVHQGFIFGRVPKVMPLYSGYIGGKGPEYFLAIEPGQSFSIHRRFPRKDNERDSIVSYEEGGITVWSPDRYTEWVEQGKPMIAHYL
jgi:hypothetical protein